MIQKSKKVNTKKINQIMRNSQNKIMIQMKKPKGLKQMKQYYINLLLLLKMPLFIRMRKNFKKLLINL